MSSLSRLSERTINFLWVRKKLFYCFRNWTLPGLRNTQENVFEIRKEKFEYCNCNQNASNVFFFFSQSQRLQLVSWPPSDFQAFTRAVLPHNLPGEKLSKFSQSLSKPDFSMVKTTTKKIVTKTPISQEKHSSMHSHKVSARRPFFFLLSFCKAEMHSLWDFLQAWVDPESVYVQILAWLIDHAANKSCCILMWCLLGLGFGVYL